MNTFYKINSSLATILVILFLLVSNAYAQDSTKKENTNPFENQTEIINTLINDAQKVVKDNPKIAEDYYKKAIDISSESGEEELIIKSERALASFYESTNNFSESLIHYKIVLDLAEKSEDKPLIADISIKIANINSMISKYNQSLESNLKALEIYKELDNQKGIAESLHNISIIYFYILNFSKAQEYNFKALDIFRKLRDTDGIAKSYSNIAMIYNSLDSLDKAVEFNNKALHLMEKTGNKKGIANIYTNLGIALRKKKEYDKSLSYLFKALDSFDSETNRRSRIIVLAAIGSVYYSMSDYTNALKYCDEGFELSGISQYPDLLAYIYNLYSDIYLKLGNYEKAYSYETKFSTIKDSIFNESNRNKISELEVKIETEQKSKENELLQKTNRLQLILLVVSIVLALIIAIVLYSRYRTKKKANKLLEEKNKLITEQKDNLEILNTELNEANAAKDKFFSIMAHDLKSPLWWLKNVTDLLSSKYDELSKDKIIEITKTLDESAQTSLHLVENLLQWSRSQTGRIEFQPETVNMSSVFKHIMGQHQPYAAEKNIEIETNINENSVLVADKNMLYSILRNIISNAIKFTPKGGKINIDYYQSDNDYIISVKDTGVGIEADKIDKIFRIDVQTTSLGTAKEQGTGIGLILTKEFVQKHGGKLTVDSKPGEGSTFTVTIPKK
jgi:signal transduction histidine kinase